MKKILILCFLMIVIASPAEAQLDTLWTRTIGGPSNDGFRSVVQTGDGGFLAVGYTYSFGEADVNVYAVKTDAQGSPVWQKTYGGSGRDYGYGVCRTADGGFAIAGYTTSFGVGEEDVYVVKIDAAGDTLWTRVYGGAGSDEARSICETVDGHLVVAGQTKSFGMGWSDLYMLKMDAGGDTVWTRTAGGSGVDWGESVCETADSCYVVCGTNGSNTDNFDMYLVKFDSEGATVWQSYFGDDGPINPDWGMSVCELQSGETMHCGHRGIEGSDPLDIGLYRADTDGARTLGRRLYDTYYEYANSICQISDGSCLLCGADKDPNTQRNNLFLVKRVDGSGWVWMQSLGGDGSDWGSCIIEIAAGEYLVAGHTDSFGAGGFDGWLVRLRDPLLASVEEVPRTVGPRFMSQPSPNPASGAVAFSMHLPESGPLEVRVLSVEGRVVRTLHRGQVPAGSRSFVWDARNDEGRKVACGVYLILAEGVVRDCRRAVIVH